MLQATPARYTHGGTSLPAFARSDHGLRCRRRRRPPGADPPSPLPRHARAPSSHQTLGAHRLQRTTGTVRGQRPWTYGRRASPLGAGACRGRGLYWRSSRWRRMGAVVVGGRRQLFSALVSRFWIGTSTSKTRRSLVDAKMVSMQLSTWTDMRGRVHASFPIGPQPRLVAPRTLNTNTVAFISRPKYFWLLKREERYIMVMAQLDTCNI
jgi:hypothetical protein